MHNLFSSALALISSCTSVVWRSCSII